MRLRLPWGNIQQSEALTGGKRAGDSERTSASSVANVNRQIRSLVPGQTIHGEIVGRNGSEVQIRVSNDVVIQARVDQNMNLEVGKSMTFEVRNNGRALTLSPLFTNISADVNVMKAIDMSGLPFNETTVAMTSQMMEAGLPVDKNSMLQMYREISSYPQAEISDVVNLHKLGLPVNEANINQMISYRNLTHQLTEGMNDVLDALPEAMEGMLEEGNLGGLAGLYQELFDMIGEGAILPEQDPEALPGVGTEMENAELNMIPGEVLTADGAVVATPGTAAGLLLDALAEAGEGTEAVTQQASAGEQGASAAEGQTGEAASRTMISKQLLDVLTQLPLSPEEAETLANQLAQFGQGELTTQQMFAVAGRLLQAAQNADNMVSNLHHVFSGKEFKELMDAELKNLWTVKPEELEETGKLETLYRRLDRQLKGLSQVLEAGGQAESGAFRATTSMTQNIDFLNQLNQMYSYVQLPLKMGDGETHGDLYVYTNKRSLAAKEGRISALLHLDMEHLGPVDVYVTLEHSRVSTRFYVQNDEMLDFLEAHMDILTKRLEKRGYDLSVSMTVREGQEDVSSGIAPILSQEKGMMVSQYAFDVRT